MEKIYSDLTVVGGGISGICASLAAARNGKSPSKAVRPKQLAQTLIYNFIDVIGICKLRYEE